MRPKVLFVDDEAFKVKKWTLRLNEDFDVRLIDGAAAAISYFDENLDVMAMVLDFMMPTPPGVATSATEGDLATGAYVLRMLKDTLITLPCPVVILTNRDLKIVESAVAELSFPKGLVGVRLKSGLQPDELNFLVGQLIAKWCKMG